MLFPPQEPKDEGDDNTEKYARCQGKVEREVLPLNYDVTGKSSDPRDFSRKKEKSAHRNNDDPEDNKKSPDILDAITHSSRAGHRRTGVLCPLSF